MSSQSPTSTEVHTRSLLAVERFLTADFAEHPPMASLFTEASLTEP